MRGIKASLALLLFALGLCLTHTTLAQEEQTRKHLPNLYRVSDGLYRGGQPTDQGLTLLVQLGVRTIVNLRDDDSRARAEEAEALRAGLRYFNVPLPTFHSPSSEKVSEILSIISAPENQPVFVHCKRGADRTGTIIAIYRIEYDGWTDGSAKEEAERFGFGFWQFRMKAYLADYYRLKRARSEGNAPQNQRPR